MDAQNKIRQAVLIACRENERASRLLKMCAASALERWIVAPVQVSEPSPATRKMSVFTGVGPCDYPLQWTLISSADSGPVKSRRAGVQVGSDLSLIRDQDGRADGLGIVS
jgi:hypothetical protein